MIRFTLNGEKVAVDVPADWPLVWVLREVLELTGTKFSCGNGLCGACTVHVGGRATRACITPTGAIDGAEVVTIEGLPDDHPVKAAWRALDVPQCGFCQPGQIMQAAALLADFPDPDAAAIDAGMAGNLCRCMAYPRIRAAIGRAARDLRKGKA